MKRVQISFTEAEAAALRERAKEAGLPLTALVRDAVDAWLAAEELQRRWDRALAGVGGFRSGLNDVGENHDEYFVQAIEERIGRR
ncbi:MAG TPA: ribbon-helix-helix protein, CopG family [Candidatus Polarisedimenticolia bacterium]|nr:ribbon-helix-helix protein, CopG family [Candidatus Polarisedimenticolia bacterium]